jgi:hypothetical protein
MKQSETFVLVVCTLDENHYILFGWRTVETMDRVLSPLILNAPFRFS